MKKVIMGAIMASALLVAGCSAELPPDDVLNQAIDKKASMSFTHNLLSYKIDNSYERIIDGENVLFVEYIAEFELKSVFAEGSTFRGQPKLVTKSGSVALVKRGNKWYLK